MKPLIGISCCTKPFGPYGVINHAASSPYVRAVDNAVKGVSLLIPANGEAADIGTLLARLDGLMFTGSRSNVDPALYGGHPHSEGTAEDKMRDAVTLPLMRRAITQGVPVLAICRGLQEMNVAFGGTLEQALPTTPIDHRTPVSDQNAVRIGKRHSVRLVTGSWLAELAGVAEIPVNSMHGQGIAALGKGLQIDGIAPDGLAEAISVVGSPGFAVGVQWHPECDFQSDAVSRGLFEAFGDAVRQRMNGLRSEPARREAAASTDP